MGLLLYATGEIKGEGVLITCLSYIIGFPLFGFVGGAIYALIFNVSTKIVGGWEVIAKLTPVPETITILK
jgi:hypothetical protein